MFDFGITAISYVQPNLSLGSLWRLMPWFSEAWVAFGANHHTRWSRAPRDAAWEQIPWSRWPNPHVTVFDVGAAWDSRPDLVSQMAL